MIVERHHPRQPSEVQGGDLPRPARPGDGEAVKRTRRDERAVATSDAPRRRLHEPGLLYEPPRAQELGEGAEISRREGAERGGGWAEVVGGGFQGES